MTVVANAHLIAVCLGVDESAVHRLQARGYLLVFDLTALEVRERLYRGHVAYCRSVAGFRGGPLLRCVPRTPIAGAEPRRR